MDLSDRAFDAYDRRSDRLDGDETEKEAWFAAHVAMSYVPHLPTNEGCAILEIGCNRGYLLKALRSAGYRQLSGVDLSPGDLAIARRRTGLDDLFNIGAIEYLTAHPSSFDVIILKAVLEHVPRDQIEPTMLAIRTSLRPGGRVICEVPNMDWYAASHERYMDLTHQSGFTQESLEQLFSLYFDNVSVGPVLDPAHGALAPRSRLVMRRIVLGFARWILRVIGEQTAEYPFDSRSIMAVAVARSR